MVCDVKRVIYSTMVIAIIWKGAGEPWRNHRKLYNSRLYLLYLWLYRVYMLKCLSCHSLFVMESRVKTMEWDKTSKWLMTKTGKNFWLYYTYIYIVYPVFSSVLCDIIFEFKSSFSFFYCKPYSTNEKYPREIISIRNFFLYFFIFFCLNVVLFENMWVSWLLWYYCFLVY